MREKRYQDAIPLLLSLNKDEIKEWVLYYAVGQCYKLTGNLPFARRFLEAAKQINVMNDEIAYALGDVYHLSIRYEDAIKAYEDVVSLAPNRIAAYNKIGLIYTQMGEIGKAMVWYRKGLDRIESLESAGARMKQAQYEHILMAKLELGFVFPLKKEEDTIDLDILKAVITNNIGICHLQRKAYDEARKYFREAIALLPKKTRYDAPQIYMVTLEEMVQYESKDRYRSEVMRLTR